VRHEDERDRHAVEDDVVFPQPFRESQLERRALVAELRELDEVLELQVVDVIDQARSLIGDYRRGVRRGAAFRR
jgi:hypothetical protein